MNYKKLIKISDSSLDIEDIKEAFKPYDIELEESVYSIKLDGDLVGKIHGKNIKGFTPEEIVKILNEAPDLVDFYPRVDEDRPECLTVCLDYHPQYAYDDFDPREVIKNNKELANHLPEDFEDLDEDEQYEVVRDLSEEYVTLYRPEGWEWFDIDEHHGAYFELFYRIEQ